MLVAIVNQTSPSGQVPIEEVRVAASEAAAVTAFVNDYTPPLVEADYLGFDTGWSVWQDPGAGKVWAYDFGAPGLVAVAAGPSRDWRYPCAYTLVQPGDDVQALPTGGPTASDQILIAKSTNNFGPTVTVQDGGTAVTGFVLPAGEYRVGFRVDWQGTVLPTIVTTHLRNVTDAQVIIAYVHTTSGGATTAQVESFFFKLAATKTVMFEYVTGNDQQATDRIDYFVLERVA